MGVDGISMEGFRFSLASNVSLKAGPEGFFLISCAPVKILCLNESLYNVLKHISESSEVIDIQTTNPKETLKVLLTLVARGYLKLERIAPLTEFPYVSIIIPVRDQSEDLDSP